MGKGSEKTRTAVVLLNLGGPRTIEDVKPFLMSLFSDPAILTLPNPFRYGLAKWITKKRLPEAHHIYSLLGGGSPLLSKHPRSGRSFGSNTRGGLQRLCQHASCGSQSSHHGLRRLSPINPMRSFFSPFIPSTQQPRPNQPLKHGRRLQRGFLVEHTAIHELPLSKRLCRGSRHPL